MQEIEPFETKKSLGQHFLTSDIVPKWMCEASDIQAGETILEVGPGTGILTKELLALGARVIALEADIRAVDVLKESFKSEIESGQLMLHHTDVREFDITKYSLTHQGFKVVSNIPYYLSGMLFRLFLQSDIQPSHLVFLVQKEVAQRIAKSTKESLLSLSVKVFGEPKYMQTVTKGHFAPPPKIDSAIISVEHISNDNFKKISQKLFFDSIRIGFGQKRKQLLGNLSKTYDRTALTNIFSTLSLPPDIRAEDLTLEKWLTLVDALQNINNT
ncbi:MAG: 16S rRNA (adenine1518-N6/adenine1519-N6)-dimethyltransferase [Candidatus Azotimanducaceae bacterium]|jgi:16S rRNA (adenine1518-N6/adenine1519-N6)-dimethyltransferase